MLNNLNKENFSEGICLWHERSLYMAYKYHPNARTTVQIRYEIKHSPLGARDAARKFNVHENTIRKWRKRNEENLQDRSHATTIKSYTLTEFEQKLIAEVKKSTLFSIDDLLEILKPFIPNLNKGNLYRTLKQKGLNNNKLILPPEETEKPPIKRFKEYEPGYIHMDIKYLPKINKQRKYLFVAIDRKTRLVFINIYDDKSAQSAENFLEKIIKFYPFVIHKILTDNGKEFTDRFRRNTNPSRLGLAETDYKPTGKHIFDKKCSKHNIEHRLTKPSANWRTNGMVERMNRRIQDNVLKPIICKSYKELENNINKYINNYNFYIKQKNLDYLSPVEFLKSHYKVDKWKYLNQHNQAEVYKVEISYDC